MKSHLKIVYSQWYFGIILFSILVLFLYVLYFHWSCALAWLMAWHKINNDAHNRTQRFQHTIERVLMEWSDVVVENAKIKDNLSLARIGSNKR